MKEYIKDNYCDDDELRNYADLISRGELEESYTENGKVYYKQAPFDKKVYLAFSGGLNERPVILIVNKNILECISQSNYGRINRDD